MKLTPFSVLVLSKQVWSYFSCTSIQPAEVRFSETDHITPEFVYEYPFGLEKTGRRSTNLMMVEYWELSMSSQKCLVADDVLLATLSS